MSTRERVASARVESWHCPPNPCLTGAQRRLLEAWLLEHGIAGRLVGDLCTTVGRDSSGNLTQLLHLSVYATDALGHRYLDQAANRAQTWPLTVPLIRPPPAGIATWTRR